MSLGIIKRAIIGQFLSEILIISLIAFSLSFLTGMEQFSSGVVSGSASTYTGDYIQGDLIAEILNIDGAEDYNAITSVFAAFDDSSYIPGMLEIESDYSDHMGSVAVTNSEYYKFFQSRQYTLDEGRHIAADDGNTTLISR